MRAQSLVRRRVNRPRAEAEEALYDTAPWCARCGRPGVELHGHERLSRAQGGTPAAPDCLLCNACNEYLEDFPAAAAWDGWKLSRKHARCPGLDPDEAFQLGGGIYTFGGAA
jgi:hypothetical protein